MATDINGFPGIATDINGFVCTVSFTFIIRTISATDINGFVFVLLLEQYLEIEGSGMGDKMLRI